MQVSNTGLGRALNSAALSARSGQALSSARSEQKIKEGVFAIAMRKAGMEMGQAAARAQMQAWMINQAKQEGNTAVTDAANGVSPPWKNPISDATYKAILNGASNLPPEQQGAYLGMANEQVSLALRQQDLSRAEEEVQRLAEEGGMDPAQAKTLVQEMQDASNPDISPDKVMELVRNHRNAAAQSVTQKHVSERTVGQMQDLIEGQTGVALRAMLGIDDKTWMERQARALLVMYQYQQFSTEVHPADALREVRSVLFPGSGKNNPDREKAMKLAQSDSRWLTADGIEGRRAILNEYISLQSGQPPAALGGGDGGMGTIGPPVQLGQGGGVQDAVQRTPLGMARSQSSVRPPLGSPGGGGALDTMRAIGNEQTGAQPVRAQVDPLAPAPGFQETGQPQPMAALPQNYQESYFDYMGQIMASKRDASGPEIKAYMQQVGIAGLSQMDFARIQEAAVVHMDEAKSQSQYQDILSSGGAKGLPRKAQAALAKVREMGYTGLWEEKPLRAWMKDHDVDSVTTNAVVRTIRKYNKRGNFSLSDTQPEYRAAFGTRY